MAAFLQSPLQGQGHSFPSGENISAVSHNEPELFWATVGQKSQGLFCESTLVYQADGRIEISNVILSLCLSRAIHRLAKVGDTLARDYSRYV